MNKKDREKFEAGLSAASLVKNGEVVGLGTGSTAYFAIKALAERMRQGLMISGVPSSIATQKLAQSLGIPLLEIGDVGSIDISIDGADEFNEDLQLIKGGGGALFREKVIASLSKRSVIVADSSKKVDKLGAFKVPIEIVPAAYRYAVNQIERYGGNVRLRRKQDQIFITDNHNYIVDVDFGLIEDPVQLSDDLNQITGLLAHGLFINLATEVLMVKDGELIRYTSSL